MYVTRHDDFASLTSSKGVWNELARGVPFRCWEWLEAWWRHYGFHDDGQPLRYHELFVLAVWTDRDELICIAPWYRLTARSGTRLVRFLGDGEVCSEYASVLCLPEHEYAVNAALADWLTEMNQAERRDDAERWVRLELAAVDAADSSVGHLLRQLEYRGNRVYFDDAPRCWRVSLPATWDEYLSNLSRKFRARLRQADKRWLQSGRVKTHFAPGEDDPETAFNVLVELHQRRWQNRGQPGCFASRAFEGFHRDVWRKLRATGQAVIGWLELDGAPLAADYLLIGDDVVYGYQSGIDPDRLDVEPGQLVNMMVLRFAIERGYRAYDLLRGDEPYKAHWRAEPRPMLAASVVPHHTTARLRYAAWNAGQQMRRFAKRGWQAAQRWGITRTDEQKPAKETV